MDNAQQQSLIAEVTKWIEEDPDEQTRTQLKKLLEEKNFTELESCFSGFLDISVFFDIEVFLDDEFFFGFSSS